MMKCGKCRRRRYVGDLEGKQAGRRDGDRKGKINKEGKGAGSRDGRSNIKIYIYIYIKYIIVTRITEKYRSPYTGIQKYIIRYIDIFIYISVSSI